MSNSIYLGSSFAAVSAGQQTTVFKFDGLHRDTLNDSFAAFRKRSKGFWNQRVDVLLSASIAKPFLLMAVDGVQSFDESIALAKSTAADATGLNDECDVALESRDDNGNALAIAVLKSHMEEMRAAAVAAKVSIVSVRPMWAHAISVLNQMSPSSSAILVIERDAATAIIEEAVGYRLAQAYVPSPTRQGIEGIVRRIGLGASDGKLAIEVADVDPVDWGRDQGALRWSTM